MPSSEHSGLVLERMGVPDVKHTYVLGSFASHVTLHAQQKRAYNLIWALFDQDELRAGRSIAVIGGGLAGLTAATAAVLKDCVVTLFESAHNLLHLQQGNKTRFLHPNILDWPRSDAEVAATQLPFLNWRAGYANNVVDQIMAEWEAIAGRTEQLTGYTVDHISHQNGATWVRARGNRFHHKPYDCVILAVGFGLERHLANTRFRSYWENDGLHQSLSVADGPRRVLVTGCGDGGIIDSLRLRINNFDHAKFVTEFMRSADAELIRDKVSNLDDNVGQLPEQYDVGMYLYNEYASLDLSDRLVSNFLATLRKDTYVTLNSPRVNPISIKASSLNRFLLFLLLTYGGVEYQEGAVEVASASQSTFRVNFKRDDGSMVAKEFNEVVVRHGPEPIINCLISDKAVEFFKAIWASRFDYTSRRMWPEHFYPEPSDFTIEGRHRTQNLFLGFNDAYHLLYKPDSIQSVGIGETDGRLAYAVTLKPHMTKPESLPDKLGEMRVIYISSKEEPASNAIESREQVGLKLLRGYDGVLHMGTAIHNYAQDERDGNLLRGFVSIGTLGGFVRLDTGEIALLGANHSLAASNRATIGDAIGVLSSDQSAAVAKLHAFVPLLYSPPNAKPGEGGVVFNELDAAVAILNLNVNYTPRFSPELNVSPPTGVGVPTIGDRVFKVGRTTGVTVGTVETVSCILGPIHFESGNCWFRGLFEIRGVGGTRFSDSGDAGALVVREDGVVIGVLFAGTDTSSYASPIETVLDAFNCSMLI
jgi:hypothetical protein